MLDCLYGAISPDGTVCNMTILYKKISLLKPIILSEPKNTLPKLQPTPKKFQGEKRKDSTTDIKFEMRYP